MGSGVFIINICYMVGLLGQPERNGEDALMKVYITKYALSSGIFEAEGELSQHDSNYFRVPGAYMSFDSSEWHRSFESAVSKAEEMRKKKIASLQNQVVKLQKMTFDKVKPWK